MQEEFKKYVKIDMLNKSVVALSLRCRALLSSTLEKSLGLLKPQSQKLRDRHNLDSLSESRIICQHVSHS